MKELQTNDDGVGLGQWLGRRQAYSLVAGTCSAADAKCLAELRQEKRYRKLGLSWEDFCRQRLGMHRSKADEIIRWFRELGPTYFTLHQVTGITPDEYRAIRGAIEDGSLRHRNDAIPINAEHAPRLLEAVKDLAPPHFKTPRNPPGSNPDTPSPFLVAEEAFHKALEAVKHLQRGHLNHEDYHRLVGLIGRVGIEMKLVSHDMPH